MSNGTINYAEEAKRALKGQSYSTDTGDSTTDYYNALKNESYKSLLNSEVQASIARDQALKYTNNSLRQNGYGNQGIAESTNLGLQSQYQAALANAANQYKSSMDTITQNQRNEQLKQQDDNFKTMTTLMNGAVETGDINQLNEIIKTYGYGSLNENGVMDWTKLDNSNLDINSKNQIKTLYSMYNAQLEQTKPSLNSLEALNQATYVGDGNKVYTLGEYFPAEMKYLWHKGSNGEYQKGDTVRVKNGRGETIYVQWVGNGFKVITKEQYHESDVNHVLTWNNRTKQIEYKETNMA